MLNGVCMDAGAFFARQLYCAATSTKGRIALRGFVMTIAHLFNIIPDDDERVPGSEQLDKASFKLMSFCKVEASQLFWVYLGVNLCLFLM